MAETETATQESLLYTSTWAIASTCALFVLVSVLVERSIFFIAQALKKRKQAALYEALEKIKDELMLVGFISLALTVGQGEIVKICVPKKWAEVMLMCKKSSGSGGANDQKEEISLEEHAIEAFTRRSLAAGASVQSCPEGKAPFIPSEGLHQLHILVFVLAVAHVVYSVAIMALGIWKVNHWKAWEKRATTKENLTNHGNARYTKETTFVRNRGIGIWYTNPILGYVVAFSRQFFHSVTETDYHTLRHGFIKSHMPGNLEFDFHKYILRSLEDDFKHVVGISPFLWTYAIFLMLINIDGWEAHFWFSFIPLVLVLIIGTKLQHIITRMAVRMAKRHAVTEGMPDIVPRDEHFWFNRPRFILYCIHFVLFQNALVLSYRVWVAVTFSNDDCLNDGRAVLAASLVLGVLAQILCGYITLPIYALVVQMGSQMKTTVFNEHIQVALVNWHHDAQRHLRDNVHYVRTPDVEDVEGSSHPDYHHQHHYMEELQQGGEIKSDDMKERAVRGQV